MLTTYSDGRSTSSLQDTHASLYIGTLINKAMTSNWRKYKHSSGTLKTILYLIVSTDRAFAGSTHTDPPSMTYSSYITDELSTVTSLGKMAEKEIDEAVRQLKANWMDETPFRRRIQEFRDKALSIISRLRSPRAIIVAF
jgi:hypothetical protein